MAHSSWLTMKASKELFKFSVNVEVNDNSQDKGKDLIQGVIRKPLFEIVKNLVIKIHMFSAVDSRPPADPLRLLPKKTAGLLPLPTLRQRDYEDGLTRCFIWTS